MKAAILTIGDELLIGQVLNSNVQWISQQLAVIGVPVATQLTVSDDIEQLQKTFRMLQDSHGVILVGGGLGPTHDDVTVEALAKYFQTSLVFDAEWNEKVKNFFKQRGREMPANNHKQSMIPAGFERLNNEMGTAPGLWHESDHRGIWAVFPGVPYEMKFLFQKHILPRLSKVSTGTRLLQKTFLTTGVGESILATRLESVQADLDQELKLAYLPSPLGVRLRVTAYALTSTQQELESKVQKLSQKLPALLGKDFYGEGDETLEEIVGQLLKQKNLKVAIAESCTGGLILRRLTSVPGSSDYVQGGIVAYQNSIKVSELGVDPHVLANETAVCATVAEQMAAGVRKKWGANVGLATTGIMGPAGGSESHPVGLAYLGISDANGSEARKMIFEKDRARNQERTAQAALDFLRRRLSF